MFRFGAGDVYNCNTPMLAAGSYYCPTFSLLIAPFAAFRYEYSDWTGREISFTVPALLVEPTWITTFDAISGQFTTNLAFRLDPVNGLIDLTYLGGSDGGLTLGSQVLGEGVFGNPGFVQLRVTALEQAPEASTWWLGLGGVAAVWLRRMKR